MTSIDLNADLGEQVGHDDALLGIVTSANLAAGFHAGTPATMRHVCRVAVKGGVRIGAQVSYRDREGFGRRIIDVHPDELPSRSWGSWHQRRSGLRLDPQENEQQRASGGEEPERRGGVPTGFRGAAERVDQQH